MKSNARFLSLSTAILMVVVFTSHHVIGQEHTNLQVYESPEQMVAAAKEVITEITVDAFRDIYVRNDIFIVDVRTAAEYEAGAVPGAVNIPRGVLEFRIGQEEIWQAAGKKHPGKKDPVIVYCSSGSRGALAAKSLMQLGYKNVKSVKGGWGAWHEAYPGIKE